MTSDITYSTTYLFVLTDAQLVRNFSNKQSSVRSWVAEEIAGNVITRSSLEGHAEVCRWFYKEIACKEQWWAQNIHGEKFQPVGRIIIYKIINDSFSLYMNNSSADFKFFYFFLPSFNPFSIEISWRVRALEILVIYSSRIQTYYNKLQNLST